MNAMEKRKLEKIMLFAVELLAIFINGVVGGKSGRESHLEMEKNLKQLNKPVVKTIKSEYGEIIDCVDIYKQPAFDNPLLKDHIIQMRPSSYPTLGGKFKTSSSMPIQQAWQKSGSCPEGTVPILRTNESSSIPAMTPTSNGKKDGNGVVEAAGAAVKKNQYYGTYSWLSLWNPHVESNEFSAAAIFVSNVDNWISVGWKIMQQQFGDSNARFYIYWTADGGQKTGCYNLLCSGFIQVDQSVAPGSTITPVSTYGSTDCFIDLTVFLDHEKQSWWLGVHDKLVGYWPLSLFSNLNSASMIEWAGEVLNTNAGGHHTVTQMGSGHFPSEGYERAAYFRNILVLDQDDTTKYRLPNEAQSFATNPRCYDVEDIRDGFFYGGPGFGPDCS